MIEHFFNALKKVRLIHGHSLQNLADELGISRTTYTRYENGDIAIRQDHMLKIAEFYKMSLDELLHYGDPNHKVEEPKPFYKKLQIPITITLDGSKETLDFWLDKLSAINAAL